jgi:hypothetical protein
MNTINLTISARTELTHQSWGASLIKDGGKVYFTESCDIDLHDHGNFDAPCVEVEASDLELLKSEMWANREQPTPTIKKYRLALR